MSTTSLRQQFLLRDDITFLNFGSFGACPKPIFDTYQNFQRELESEPVDFIAVKTPLYLKASRQALGRYVHCHEDDIVFVTNPSYAVNLIAKSLNLQQGDEVLTTDLEYGACDRTWNYYCQKYGAKYVQQPVRFPLESKEDFIQQFIKGITDKTRLIFLSHITSSTALRLPVEEICKIAAERGIMTFVDGAHAPGQISLNLSEMGVDIYTGACHKWMMAPKGNSFLYVKKEYQHLFDPLVVSWGFGNPSYTQTQFLDYHESQGTRDTSAFCTLPACIDFMEKYHWPEVASSCRKLVQDNAPELCHILGKTALSPISDDFIQQMFSCEIDTPNAAQLHDLLYAKYKIQIPVMPHRDKTYIRYSVNAFNSQEDLDRLFAALKDIFH